MAAHKTRHVKYTKTYKDSVQYSMAYPVSIYVGKYVRQLVVSNIEDNAVHVLTDKIDCVLATSHANWLGLHIRQTRSAYVQSTTTFIAVNAYTQVSIVTSQNMQYHSNPAV